MVMGVVAPISALANDNIGDFEISNNNDTHELFDDETNFNEVEDNRENYSDEIVKAEMPPDLSEYKMITVTNFKELLKTVLSAGNHIIYYSDPDTAYFYVLTARLAYAYCFNIN
ncbi:MAG: DUF5305 domain-containing protein [Oscillospiraceae bacterium]|nr:DUF5305 domain-containing protein [Oscillospiraceae bacterium]